MIAVDLAEMRAAESMAKDNGWSEEAMLDLAGQRLGQALGRFWGHGGTAIAYLGKGHNAGDSLVALRVLRDDWGWHVAIRAAYPLTEMATLTRRKWRELGDEPPLANPPCPQDGPTPMVLLDGLLGAGARGPLRKPLLALAAEMNDLRQLAGAKVVAVDIPSGVDADTGEAAPGHVTADQTWMIGNAKRGLLMARAVNAVGALGLVPVDCLARDGSENDPLTMIAPQSLDWAKAPRPFDFHKGQAGRVAVIAGSEAYPGAAVLAAIGALRGGGGLVTLYFPKIAAATIAPRCPPELILHAYESPWELQTLRADAWVIGCGGDYARGDDAMAMLACIESIPGPAVLDAEALNLIAREGRLDLLKHQHVITPHPGEFERLAPKLTEFSREDAVRAWVRQYPAVLLLKGARTLVAQTGQALCCNSTGSPGMATGGQGDFLAGVIAAALAAGSPPLEAAAVSAWACGRAAERALQTGNLSDQSLIPSDLAAHLGAAFLDWKRAWR